MTQPNITCELLSLLEYYQLKKTLKAFKKEVGNINVNKTAPVEDIINQIILSREVFQRKDRKRKRKEDTILKNEVKNILEQSKQATWSCAEQNKENLSIKEETDETSQKKKIRKLCKEDPVKSYKQKFNSFCETSQKNDVSQDHENNSKLLSQQIENLSTLPSSCANEGWCAEHIFFLN
jgi:Mg-chelatase subunit ChlI